jgi:subtilisin family serine protease
MLPVLLASLLAAATPVSAREPKEPSVPEHVADQALVGITRGDFSEAENSIENYGADVLDYFESGKVVLVDTPGQATDWVQRFQEAVKRWDFLKFVQLDYIVHAETHGDSPNDTLWSRLYGMQKIGVEEAWHATTGSKDVVVGVIDSGVDYTHPDLASQMWKNPGESGTTATGTPKATNGDDDDGNGWIDDVYGLDCHNNDGNPMDDNDHGTHVSGTIGAATNNGQGVAGVNQNVSIMALKFLSASGSGSTSNAIECLEYAISKGADLTSNSWGGGGYSQALYDTIKKAGTHPANQLFVAAAGNSGVNTDSSPHYPSSYDLDNIISVAATDSNDALASFSNYGVKSVDLGAPGVGIWSTVPGNAYDSFSGTSMATPHVAGAAALLLSQYPSDLYGTLRERIYSNVTPISALTNKSVTGGRLNISNAMVPDTIGPGPAPITVGAKTPTSIALSWQAPFEDGNTGGPASSYQLRYAAGTTGWATVPTPTPGLPGTAQNVVVRGLTPNTAYDFSLTSTDNGGNVSAPDLANATTETAGVRFADDMESGITNWTPTSPWAITTERPQSPSNSWSDSPGGSYANNRDASVLSKTFSLVGVETPKLSFWHRYNLEPGYDYAYVYCSTNGGSTWNQLARYDGAASYQPVELSLSTCANSSTVSLRFRITTDSSVIDDGWYFDDVVVSGVVPEPDTTAPAAPVNLTATAGNQQVALKWDNNTESDIAGYRVFRTTDLGSWPTTPIATRTSSDYTDTGLTAGTTYHYRVIAYDTSSNESEPSTAAFATPTRTPLTKNFAPSSVSTPPLWGTVRSGSYSNLATDNGSYYRVNASRIGSGLPYFSDWYAQSILDVTGVTKLTVTYNGRVSSSSATQRIYVGRSDGSWHLIATITSTSSDRTTTWSTTNPYDYVAPGNAMRLRVETQRSSSHYSSGDFVRFAVEY